MSRASTVGVVGAGTMGAGIAIASARAGFRTLVVDSSEEKLAGARGKASMFLRRSVEKGKLEAQAAAQVERNFVWTADARRLEDCELVIEAVFESLPVKHKLFSELNRICKPACIFASNTSTLSITEIAAGSGRADRVVGMHFCLPAQIMQLVEMSPGLQTAPETLRAAWQMCEDMGQRPVLTRDSPGFILNHFVVPYHNDAIRLVEDGVAEPQEIDKAVRAGLGYPMGPLELLDLVGLDTQALLCDALHAATHDRRAACPPLVRRMIAAGHLGKKAGRGFHVYSDDRMFGA